MRKKPLSNSSSQTANKRLLVGKINGLFGTQGWVKIFSHTHPRENILCYQPWHVKIGGIWQTLEIVSGRKQGKTLVAQIKNINSPEQVQVFLGLQVFIEKSQLPMLKKDQYYWQDLIGLKVINQQNVVLGTVANLVDTGSNTVLVIAGKQQYLVPYTDEFLIKVDISQQQILVDWDENF